MKNTRKNSLTYFLWALGDIEIINAIAKAYAEGQERSRTRLAFLLVVTGALAVMFGAGTWYFDIQPTRDFVFEVAHRVAPDLNTAAALVGWSLLMLSLLPNMLEFGATGLAIRGSIAVEVLILLSMLFDMGTDAPNATYWSGVLLDVMLSHYPAIPAWLVFPIRLFITVPLLFMFTVGIEIAFMTFAISFWRLLLAYFVGERVYKAERSARRSRARGANYGQRPQPRPRSAAPQGQPRYAAASPPPPRQGDFFTADEARATTF